MRACSSVNKFGLIREWTDPYTTVICLKETRSNCKQYKDVSIVTTRQFPLHQAQREWPSSYDSTGCSSIPFRVSFVSSQGFSKSGNPDVLKLVHRHSVWMIRISVLVKVNCILVKVIGIQHYSFIDLIVPCFSHKQLALRSYNAS